MGTLSKSIKRIDQAIQRLEQSKEGLDKMRKNLKNQSQQEISKDVEMLKNSVKLQPADTLYKDKRIKCIFCNNPIHIDNWAGINKDGFFCNNVFCLMKLTEENKTKERKCHHKN